LPCPTARIGGRCRSWRRRAEDKVRGDVRVRGSASSALEQRCQRCLPAEKKCDRAFLPHQRSNNAAKSCARNRAIAFEWFLVRAEALPPEFFHRLIAICFA